MARVCLTQTPWEMAKSSVRAQRARATIFEYVQRIENEKLREDVTDILLNGRFKLVDVVADGHADDDARRLRDRVKRKLAEPLPYDPTGAAPGSATNSHHCYPGGWVIHTALNLEAAMLWADQAERLKGVTLRKDAVIAAMVLHDSAKLKLLRWHEDHTLDAELSVFHHEVAIAECMVRECPPIVVKLLAGVHNGWWLQPEAVARDLQRASDWVGSKFLHCEFDSVYGGASGGVSHDVLDGTPKRDGLSVESWIMRQAEVSWYGVTRESVQRMRSVIESWMARRQLEADFQRVHNAVFCTFDELELQQKLAMAGHPSVERLLDRWFEK